MHQYQSDDQAHEQDQSDQQSQQSHSNQKKNQKNQDDLVEQKGSNKSNFHFPQLMSKCKKCVFCSKSKKNSRRNIKKTKKIKIKIAKTKYRCQGCTKQQNNQKDVALCIGCFEPYHIEKQKNRNNQSKNFQKKNSKTFKKQIKIFPEFSESFKEQSKSKSQSLQFPFNSSNQHQKSKYQISEVKQINQQHIQFSKNNIFHSSIQNNYSLNFNRFGLGSMQTHPFFHYCQHEKSFLMTMQDNRKQYQHQQQASSRNQSQIHLQNSSQSLQQSKVSSKLSSFGQYGEYEQFRQDLGFQMFLQKAEKQRQSFKKTLNVLISSEKNRDYAIIISEMVQSQIGKIIQQQQD